MWNFLGKILKFQGEIQEFPEKNIGFPEENFHFFSQKNNISPRKKKQLIMEKNKKWGFFFTCTVYAVKTDFVGQVYIVRTKIHDTKTRSLWG